MMTKATLSTQNHEIAINYIAHLLQQLTEDYQTTKEERKKLASLSSASEEEFTVLEEIEVLTSDIRGYASQIQARGRIDNEQQAIQRLQNMHVFDVPTTAQFYFATDEKYKQIKAYISNTVAKKRV